jgi:NADH-quinone oxidoreductase subunit N
VPCFAQMPAPAAPTGVAASLNPMTDAALTDALLAALRLTIPEFVLLGVACALFMFGLVVRSRLAAWTLAVVGIVAAGVAAVLVHPYEQAVYADADLTRLVLAPIDSGPGAAFVRWLALAVGLLVLLVATKEVTRETAADYFACVLIAIAGTSLVGRANDLVTLFMALELISIPTYILLYLPAQTKAAQEAAAKYFLLSVLASAILLFGFSYLYGLTGTTNLTALANAFVAAHREAVSPLATLAVVLAVAGIGFRITAVPFHFYAPDVYQGGPTGVVTQLAVVPKVAGFIALARLLGLMTPPLADQPFPAVTQVPLLLWVLAAVTMTIGNVLALLQDNLKRLLAYSGVAHGGYMLLGLVAVSAYAPRELKLTPTYFTGLETVLFYLVAYTLMTVAAFAVIFYLHSDERPVETIDDLAGAGQSNPFAAFLLGVALLSLIGLPLTAGFSGKLMLFIALFEAPAAGGLGVLYRVLVVIAAVNAAIGAVYYLRLLGAMYLRTSLRPVERARGLGPLTAAAVCTVATLLFGIYPKPLAEATRAAVPAGGATPAAETTKAG